MARVLPPRTLAHPAISHSSSLPDDLLRMIADNIVQKKDVADLKQVALSSRFLRETIAGSLYESLYFGCPGDASTFRKESQAIARYTKSLKVKIKARGHAHSWEAPNPPLRSLWKVLSEDFVNLTSLVILPPSGRSSLTKFDPPRYDLDLAIPLLPSKPFLPNLTELEIPFDQIGMLKLLSNAPDLEQVAISAVDSKALVAYNVLARKAERLVDVLDAQLPQIVQDVNDLNSHLRERYYYIPPCTHVKTIMVEAKPDLNLKDALDFVGRLFPFVEELAGHRKGTPGHVTAVTPGLIQRLKTLTRLRDLCLVYSPSVHPAPPSQVIVNSIWGVELAPPTLLAIGDASGRLRTLQSVALGRRTTETTAIPSGPLIRAKMDPLVMELAGELPRMQVIRHVYDDEADWTRDMRRRWQFQAHIDSRQIVGNVDASSSTGEDGEEGEAVDGVDGRLTEAVRAATPGGGSGEVDITWVLKVITLPVDV